MLRAPDGDIFTWAVLCRTRRPAARVCAEGQEALERERQSVQRFQGFLVVEQQLRQKAESIILVLEAELNASKARDGGVFSGGALNNGGVVPAGTTIPYAHTHIYIGHLFFNTCCNTSNRAATELQHYPLCC